LGSSIRMTQHSDYLLKRQIIGFIISKDRKCAGAGFVRG
jgi:hypothetical protein